MATTTITDDELLAVIRLAARLVDKLRDINDLVPDVLDVDDLNLVDDELLDASHRLRARMRGNDE